MRKSAFLYRSQGSSQKLRRAFLIWALIWIGVLFCQVLLGYFVISSEFTSPINGFLMAVGAATLVTTIFSWNRVVGKTLLQNVFIYPDRVVTRYRNQASRVFRFPEGVEFRLYRFPGLKRAYLRISAKNSEAIQWVRITDAPALKKAFQESNLSFSCESLMYPTIIGSGVLVFAFAAFTGHVFILWLGCAALFSFLYSIGYYKKPVRDEEVENPHRANQIAVMFHSLVMLTGMWLSLAAQQIPISEEDRAFQETRYEIHEGKYSIGVSHAVRLAEKTDSALHLNFAAWVLTTVPDPSFRDYPRAQELISRALAFESTPQLQDTFACALMGNGKHAEALALAEREELRKRIPTFRDGKLCEDPTLYPEAAPSDPVSRSLASDKE